MYIILFVPKLMDKYFDCVPHALHLSSWPWNALIQHCHRATYVLKLVYSSSRSDCKDLHLELYGWQESGSCIEVSWEQHDSPDTASANDDNESTSSEEPGTD